MICFLVLAVLFCTLALVYLLVAAPLENCTMGATLGPAASMLPPPFALSTILGQLLRGRDGSPTTTMGSSSSSSGNHNGSGDDDANSIGDDSPQEQTAGAVDATAFCVIILALVVLNLGPNVATLVIAVDTAPSRIHQARTHAHTHARTHARKNDAVALVHSLAALPTRSSLARASTATHPLSPPSRPLAASPARSLAARVLHRPLSCSAPRFCRSIVRWRHLK